MGEHGLDGMLIRGPDLETGRMPIRQLGHRPILFCSAEGAGLVWRTDQMGVSPAAGPVPQCRSVPLRTTMVHADSQVAPGKTIRMPGLCAICGDLTRVKQLLHAAAAGWKQIMGEASGKRWP